MTNKSRKTPVKESLDRHRFIKVYVAAPDTITLRLPIDSRSVVHVTDGNLLEFVDSAGTTLAQFCTWTAWVDVTPERDEVTR